MGIISAFLASTLTISAPQIDPQTQPPITDESTATTGSEIIVEEPASVRERRKELRRFAKVALNKPRIGRTLASYYVPVCPRVFGLNNTSAELIEARMRENAIALGANRRDVPADCEHNTSVIFVPKEQGTADQWLNYRSKVLNHLLSFERKWVLEERDPVRTWRYRPPSSIAPFSIKALNDRGSDGASLTTPGSPVPYYATRLNREANPIAGAVVLIELEQAAGKSLIQLADYASMRTFGNSRAIKPDEVPATQTILTLFQDEDAPGELTTFDRAMVSMLYDTSPVASQSLIYSNIARRATRLELEDKPSAEAP